MKKGVSTSTARSSKKTSSSTIQHNTSSGDKRQLPLDFSRHSLRTKVKKLTPPLEDGNATNSLIQGHPDQLHEEAAEGNLASMSLVHDPPIIRVNMTSLSFGGSGIQEGSARGTMPSVTESHSDYDTSEEQDTGYSHRDNDDIALAPQAISEGRDGDESPNAVIIEEDVADEGENVPTGFASHDATEMAQIKHGPNEQLKNEDLLPTQYRWRTVYVAAFELALDTVLPGESFLFTEEEQILFETYRSLPDDPKHLFVRLFLRSQKVWLRRAKLVNFREIKDMDSSIQQLIRAGLLMDHSLLRDTQDAISLLTIEELKLLARRVGIKETLSGKVRQVLVTTILEHFRQQSFISKRLMLAPGGHSSGGYNRKSVIATHIFSGDSIKRNAALIEKIVNISGPCVKIYPNIIRVFERLHLVFYRTKEYSEKPALIEAILAKIGQRTFPTYEITRTNNVFRNRDELLKYEEAIKVHHELSVLTESAMGAGNGAVVYVRDADQPIDRTSNRRKDVVSRLKSEIKRSGDRDKERRAEVVEIYERVVQEAEDIRDSWREYVVMETARSSKCPDYFLLRFSPGWVYTQILRLELRALAFLKRFEEESVLLHELLDQHVYSLGARGAWYDRLALIKSNYSFQKRLGKKEALEVCMLALRDKHVHAVDANMIQSRIVRLEGELKVAFRERHNFSYLTLRKAQTRILTGERLNSPGTVAPGYSSSHSYTYIPGSGANGHPITNQRPLWRNIDGSDCGVEELALSYYGTLGFKGYHSENSILATLFGLLFWDILFSPQPGVFETFYQTEPLDLRTDAFFLSRQRLIMDRLDDIAKSTVVDYSLSKESKAVKLEQDEDKEDAAQGSHQMVSTDSTLNNDCAQEDHAKLEQVDQACSVPGLKTTVEMEEESLARKRKECFFLNLLQTTDDLYREKKVFCVGVNWTFEKEELLQIAECIGASALSEICKVMAQEYRQRCSGMPDLCCWNYKKKLVKFIEVKGPGDRLSSKQQVWIDLLTSLNVDVELCVVQVSRAEDEFKQERNDLN
ncbi:hypothetical protein BG004_006758 [Podila humilis]|nr:hypothetical protein BG004_006758 [Podila humilis]